MSAANEVFLQALLDPEIDESRLVALARAADFLFVRSLDQIAEDSPQARGRRMTSFEALGAYGQDVLAEVASEGSALLCESRTAAGRALRHRRELLGLETRHIALRAGVEPRTVEAAERFERVPIRDCERIARHLGLDERFISVRAEPVGNEQLAVRLRTIGAELAPMTPSVVSAIAEAAWVAATQIRLEEALGLGRPSHAIETSPNYGGPRQPAHSYGYRLAGETRELLGLGAGALPRSLREICEEVLGIPLIQAELGDSLAGATVEVAGQRRAIVLNLGGRNRHVYVRRATIAHELAHLLYDPSPRLKELRVDDYDDLEKYAEQITDPVEQRANAFAAEFLAPQHAALRCYDTAAVDGVGAVMDMFGVSYTVARYQIWNASSRRLSLRELTTQRVRPEPAFEAMEAYTVDYHPLRQVPTPRAGRFSAIVLRAAEERVISMQTAAEYLNSAEDDLRASASAVRELFPAVFAV
jgi:Zn-dependent peptidase ImmA (M78 family)/transcriptional regulator with XRE-family HTH domain